MDTRSDNVNSSLLLDGQRLSSSLPPQPWLNHTPVTSRGCTRLFDPAVSSSPLDESTLARRTAALRQLNGLPRPFHRIHHHTTSASSRSSLPSQPVIVRTYSAEADAQIRPSAMSQGSGLLANGSGADRSPVELPSVQDFSIDGILRAIEPDIQSTLDAIAEICGRSKLSLANEYGSHRPPLGEIRASGRSPDPGLLPVEEASSSSERLVDQNIVILGDDTSTFGERNPFLSTYNLLVNAHEDTGALLYGSAILPPWSPDPFSQQTVIPPRNSSSQTGTQSLLLTSEGRRPRHSFDWALLGRGTEHRRHHHHSISTRPVVSEVLLDVQADGTYLMDTSWESYHRETSGETDDYSRNTAMNDSLLLRIRVERLSFLSDLQGLLSWFRNVGHRLDRAGDSVPSQTAEMRLRDVLQRQHSSISGAVAAGNA
ncbi:hypothetical protein PAAG_04284 [Paracoccidioides lutzii Pb01]|uniref:Uncharacterized protein n=1 Tax=Paracoccidioides lutzii (strain ATCC MYA-826 / Pb01) TaxID=502779 RepID=C1H0J0_PARBA|nr:hypothetical protein PAAG_04284 [Paracoccidioides lutzii Pb01]EEH33231.1 hypothetical protein PAAG_04284 [Paracoccidioides lutzii Pb01]